MPISTMGCVNRLTNTHGVIDNAGGRSISLHASSEESFEACPRSLDHGEDDSRCPAGRRDAPLVCPHGCMFDGYERRAFGPIARSPRPFDADLAADERPRQ